MKHKILVPSLIFASSFLLSACALKNEAELKMLNKVDRKIDNKIEEVKQEQAAEQRITPTVVVVKETDEQLLQQLNQGDDKVIDEQFKQLETEVKSKQ